MWRLLSRVQSQSNSSVNINSLYDEFKFAFVEAGQQRSPPTLHCFIDHFKCLFPNSKRIRKVNKDNVFYSVYSNVCIKPHSTDLINFADITEEMPLSYKPVLQDENVLKFASCTDCKSNGDTRMKTVAFNADGTFEISIGNKVVDLCSLDIDKKYQMNSDGVQLVFDIGTRIRICQGVRVSQSVLVNRFQTIQSMTVKDETCRCLKSMCCSVVLNINAKVNTCKVCQKMVLKTGKENIPKSVPNKMPAQEESTIVRIKKLFPNAPEPMIMLLCSQTENIDKDPRGRRWSKEFIATCLQLHNRSPKCYQLIAQMEMLILPSRSTLLMYKNALKQEPGFDSGVFEWMYDEANRRKMSEKERIGGIVFDEMAIQQDIELEKDGHVLELTGLTDLGKEGDMCNKLRKGTTVKGIGTHILQLLFLGLNGFRFPFAYFVTDNIQASEIYGLFWKAVWMLRSYGFTVLYTCMDGAQANRSFMHTCLTNVKCFMSESPCTTQPVIFMMDISHVIKKIRNNMLKSGINDKCTRLLTLPSKFTVHWQMFIDLFLWDQQNALQSHRKLSKDHVYVDAQNKMRNHLAEDVLNSEMLYTFRSYKKHLGDKGTELNGIIELLEQTSVMIRIFRDKRPIRSMDDERLQQLKDVDTWFSLWESSVEADSSVPKNKKAKQLLSRQCHEDIHSCIVGFINLCKSVFSMDTNLVVTPGLVNSDVIENMFNQQRSTYNGANTNPNVVQYKKTINSIIIGQSTISHKANAAKTSSAMPFSATMANVPRKRKSDPSQTLFTSKALRM